MSFPGQKEKEEEEKVKYRVLSGLVTIIWISSFATSFIAMYFMGKARSSLRLYHYQKGFQLVSKALLTQAIGNILWFAVTIWILASSLRERGKPLYVIAGGFFFLSGIFEIVLSYALFSFRGELLHAIHHLPALRPQEFRSLLRSAQTEYLQYRSICYPGTIGSIGVAFLSLGIYYFKFSTDILHSLRVFSSDAVPFHQAKSGVHRIWGGSICYIILSIVSILQAMMFTNLLPQFFPSWIFNVSFIFWILGMILIRSGSKKVNKVMKLEKRREKQEEKGKKDRWGVM